MAAFTLSSHGGVLGLDTASSTTSSMVYSHMGDDEDELLRATLEKRYASKLAQKKIVLVKGKRGWEVIDLTRLKPSKAASVMETVLEAAQTEGEDRSEDTLMRMIKKRADAVKVRQPSVEVRFRGLCASAKVKMSAGPGGGGKLPTISSQLTGLVTGLISKAVTCGNGENGIKEMPVLQDISGVLVPGKITLLLGPPGSGKSTFLKALAGQSKHNPTLKVTSQELTYNGQPLGDFCPERTAAYIAQRDEHYAELTVQETLDFSARVQGAGAFNKLVEEIETRESERGITPNPNTAAIMNAMVAGGKHGLTVPLMLQVLGLDNCKDTIVGNGMIRGVSGGQRKRVSTGEALMGPASTLFLDEISTGLDSATTTDIIGTLKSYARIMEGTVLVALLQPPPETFELFDDVMVLAGKGHCVYHGPRQHILPFFSSLGFECPEDVAIADFLQEVVLPDDQEKYWIGTGGGGGGGGTNSSTTFKAMQPEEMAAAFYSSPLGAAAMAPLDTPFVLSPDMPDGTLAPVGYGASKVSLLRSVFSRGATLQRRSLAISVIRLCQTGFTAFLAGTLFLQTPKESEIDALFFLAVAFFSIIIMSMLGMADAAELVEMLPPFYKQRNARFYPAWTFAVSQVALRLPWILGDATVWSLIIYFAVGFSKSVRFLAFWATCFAAALFGLTAFMAVGAACRAQTTSSAVQSFLLLVFVNTAGFVITPQSISGGWIGVFWANPWSAWLKALAVNEFTSGDWEGPATGVAEGVTLGQAFLKGRGLPSEYYWVWIGLFAWGIGSSLINLAFMAASLTFLSAHRGTVIVHDTESTSPNKADKLEKTQVKPVSIQDTPPISLLPSDVEKGGIKDDSNATAPSASSSSSALPFSPLILTFQDLKYSVPLHTSTAPDDTEGTPPGPHTGQLLLLKGITGSFRPGVLTALMGASGAGKTTLLDVLAGRKTGGTITGNIRVNGYVKDAATFSRVAGYVEQEDIHEPLATVHEALQFSAALRLPANVPAATAAAFVSEIMNLVELGPIANSPVGMPGVSGLSVEQRKRLTLAIELVANPSIVFLDEPTSGLDARAASVVMRAVRNVANTGRAVVCTIHQPSLAIFSQFQELLLLKRGGLTIFCGELGPKAVQLVAYLEAFPGVTPMPLKANPSNWMLDVTSPAAETRSGVSFADLYSRSDLARRTETQVKEHSQPAPESTPLDLASLHVAPWSRQLRELLRRDNRSYARNLSYNLTRIIISIVIGICYGSLYANQGTSTSTIDAVYNIAGALFSSVLFLGFSDNLMVQEVSSKKRAVFYREHAAGTYCASAFSLAEALIELPYLLAQSLLYSLLVYWMIGFEANAGKFFWFVAIMFLTLAYFTFGGQMAVHLTPNLMLSEAATGMVFAALQLFCGYLKPRPNIPNGWIWLYWMNPVSYTLWGLVSNQLGDVQEPIKGLSGETGTVAEFIEEFFGFTYSFYGWTAFILVGFCVAFRVAAFAAVRFLNFQKR